MISDGNSLLRSGDFVHGGDGRTSPTSYARTSDFSVLLTRKLLKFLSRLYEMRIGCAKISAVVGSC